MKKSVQADPPLTSSIDFDKDVPQNGKRRFQGGLFFHCIRVEIFKAPPRIREGGKFPKRQGVGIDSGDSGETEDEIVN